MIKHLFHTSSILWIFIISITLGNQSFLNAKAPDESWNLNVFGNENVFRQETLSDTNNCEILGGWLKLWIDQRIVINHIKQPEIKSRKEFWESTGTYVQKWKYNTLGIELEMESPKKGGCKQVRSITIIFPSELLTTKGIGIGSTNLLVNEKYLGMIDVKFSTSELIIVGSIYEGTSFYFENEKVIKIYIGALAE